MLKRIVCGLVLGMLALVGGASENLIVNGRLETDQTDLPIFWSYHVPPANLEWEPTGGPNGLPCLTVRFTEEKKGEFSIRQQGLQMMTNGHYRLTAKVRTRNFKSRNNGVLMIDSGWYHAWGVNNFPANRDWTTVSAEFTPRNSRPGQHSFVFYALDVVGELSLADVRLEALDEATRAGTKKSEIDKFSREPCLVVWTKAPRLLPRANPTMDFRVFGRLPAGAFDIAVGEVRRPLACKEATSVPLPAGWTEGQGVARLVRRGTEQELARTTFNYRVVDPVSTNGHRRLNNLVTEVLSTPFAAGTEAQTFTFTTTRDGWVFLATPKAAAAEVRLDGRCVIDAATPRGETFREVAYGPHTITVTGARAAGRLVVRQIAEIFNYCPGTNSRVAENPPYNWAFQEKYSNPCVTTQNGGQIPAEHRAEFRARGYLWLANLGTTKLADEHDLTHRLETAQGMLRPWYDGLTCDEQFFGQPAMLRAYTRGLRAFANPENRRIYTWIVGRPGTPSVDHDFLRASIEASRGRGRLLFEAYCRTRATEEEARTYLGNYVTETLRSYERWCPGAAASTGIAFGDFTQIPIISLVHHPEVDFKYFLDMQLNLVANDPAFRELGCTGYWGSYYADHEMHRWAMALLRHYCVDGNTEMLSHAYGYRYLPNHLVNGDFRGSLAGWSATGAVAVDQHRGLGARVQNRWGGNGSLGDTFATFTRAANATNTLAQTVKGLIPGRTYCLQFATFDVKDVKANRHNPRVFGVKATLGAGAELKPALCWRHVDRRVEGRYEQNTGVARINLHHLVFVARASEIPLVFDDAAAQPGECLGVNCVSLNPFYDEK